MIPATLVTISAIIALSNSIYADNLLGRPAPDLASFWYPGKQTESSLCNNNQERRIAEYNNIFQPPVNYKSAPTWIDDYSNILDETEDNEYPDEVEEFVPALRKRAVEVSPFISLGALNNLPQFFVQLKESIERKELRKAKQMAELAAAAAESHSAYRPTGTAAVLHAFRNQKPRRTRSYPPALIHGG